MKDGGNHFVDSNKGLISGSVTDEALSETLSEPLSEPLKNVTRTHTKADGSTVTTVTNTPSPVFH